MNGSDEANRKSEESAKSEEFDVLSIIMIGEVRT
jgi:hypothetical protein